jgi:AhpD family alkylhydroperoxidase
LVIKYIKPTEDPNSDPLISEIYYQIKRDFGRIVEPFALHSPIPKLLAGVWMTSRETELVGLVPRRYKEAVAATVSSLNRCPYCVDAHTIMLYSTGEKKTANAISQQKFEQISDVEIKRLINWTLTTLSPESILNHQPPFSKKAAPEIIGTVVFYHYINRIVNVLLNETPLPSNHSWLAGILKIVASKFFSKAISRSKSPGDSLKFLPRADLPVEFSWSKGNSNIKEAFASFAAVVKEIGNDTIDPEIRFVVNEYIESWRGKNPGVSKSWVKLSTKNLTGGKRVSARLALLTALAPYQVDEHIIKTFKSHFSEEEKLLGLLSWASFSAAKKIASWLEVW